MKIKQSYININNLFQLTSLSISTLLTLNLILSEKEQKHYYI